MRKIKWLHLADIHINKYGVETRRIRQKLLSYLREYHVMCDYIFCAGDLRYAPGGGFSEDTVSYLQELCTVVGIPTERLFVVPGNHDVKRDDPCRCAAISRIINGVHTREEEREAYASEIGHIDRKEFRETASGRQEFVNQMRMLYQTVPERVQQYEDIDSPHFLVTTEDLNILHLDSTLVYEKNRERELIVGTEQVMGLLEQLDPSKPTVLLTHYSFDYLQRNEQAQMVQLLRDYRVRLWLAGHEHNILTRMQRDYFYEFQCGNLLLEAQTKSCVLTGELDLDTLEGTVQARVWNSPDGWAVYPFLSHKAVGADAYVFSLKEQQDGSKPTAQETIGEKIRELSNGVRVFNLFQLNEEALSLADEGDIKRMRAQLGRRVTGQETDGEICALFRAEVLMTLNAGKRYDCMPMFQDVVREVEDVYLYVDKEFAPVARVTSCHYFYEEIDQFLFLGEYFRIGIFMYKNEIIQISQGYHLSDIKDVQERLRYFRTIHTIINADKLFVKFHSTSKTERKPKWIDLTQVKKQKQWKEQCDLTDYWIDQMRRILEIEETFGIKFQLPQKASEEEYCAINTLSNSIHHLCCVTLPPMETEEKLDVSCIQFKEETTIGDGGALPELHLFGYTFVPTRRYFIPCTIKYNRKKKIWDTKEGGIPLGVEFEVRQR